MCSTPSGADIHVYVYLFVRACARSCICAHVRALRPLSRTRHCRHHHYNLHKRILQRYATAHAPQASSAILTHKPLTASQYKAVKLERPYRRRPCCIVSDDMLGLPLLPLRACIPANNRAIMALSSCREVAGQWKGTHQEITLVYICRLI